MTLNLGPVKEISADTFSLEVDGLVEQPLDLTYSSLKSDFTKVEIVAALQVCDFPIFLSDTRHHRGVLVRR